MIVPRPFLAKFAKEQSLEDSRDPKDRRYRYVATGSAPATRIRTIITKVARETTDDS